MPDGSSVTAPTPDAVAQAREGVWGALEDWQNTTRTTAQVHRDVDAALDAYAAAVRAECAADTRRLDWMQERYVAADFEYTIDEKPATALIIHAPRSARVGPNLRATIDTALEAQP